MNHRLQKIIEYKTGGVQKDFCSIVGWSPQYLAKLLKGTNFGLAPVITIVQTFPEIDARWLMTGEGQMLNNNGVGDLHRAVMAHLDEVLLLERFIPVMTSSELKDFTDYIHGASFPGLSPSLINVWQDRLAERNEKIKGRVMDAVKKSDERCKTKEVRK